MKLALAAALAALAAAPAVAQSPAPAAQAAAAPAAAAQAQVQAQVQAAAKLSVETTPIEELVANAQAKAVLEKHLPGMVDHPAYPQFKAMTLAAVAPYSEGAIDDAKLKAIQADLDRIK